MQAIPIHLTLDTISTILSQLCALGLLIAVGTGAGNGKSGMYARFLLACQEDEVRLAFEQDPRLRNMM
jgi:origin recognition complex subunit 1